MIKKLAGILLLSGISWAAFSQTTETETKKKRGRPDLPGTFTLELGINRALDAPKNFDLGFWGARTINIYYQYDMRILKSKFSFVPGIGLSLERFKFSNGYSISYPDNSTDYVVLLSPSQSNIPGLKKSMLVTNYVDVPVEIRYSSRPEDPSRSFKASIGGRVGYMYSAMSKIKYKEDGEVKKIKDQQNFNVNQFRYGVFAKLGVGNFAVFGYYNLTPLFKEDEGLRDDNNQPNNFSTFTVGISLASF